MAKGSFQVKKVQSVLVDNRHSIVKVVKFCYSYDCHLRIFLFLIRFLKPVLFIASKLIDSKLHY